MFPRSITAPSAWRWTRPGRPPRSRRRSPRSTGVAGGDASVSLSPCRIYNDEITVLGSMAVLNSFGAAADLMAAGTIQTSPLLSPPFGLDRFAEALASARRGEAIKLQVAPAA